MSEINKSKTNAAISKITVFILILFSCGVIFCDIFYAEKSLKYRIIIEKYIVLEKFSCTNFFNNFINLKSNIFEMIKNQNLITDLKKDNERLSDALSIAIKNIGLEMKFKEYIKDNPNSLENFNFTAAKLLLLNNFDQTLILSGYMNKDIKIKENDLILNDCGIIGKVLSVRHGDCVRAISINNKNFNLPVMIKDSSNNNIIFGIYNGTSGIKELSGQYSLKSTDDIETCGLDSKSTIPSGIKIKQNDICKYNINEIVYIVSKL